jgi:hypothetical protein
MGRAEDDMSGNSLKLMLVALATLALPAAGQVASGRAGVVPRTHVTAARTPYTAEYKITSIKTLADGSSITRDSTEVVAVDSEGRRMSQMTFTLSKSQKTVTNVNLFDPVAKTYTHWSSFDKLTTIVPLAGREHGCPSEPRPASTTRSTSTTENLGTASIQGVEARGTRTTRTIAAGEVGNETPLVTTIERWTAVAVGLRGLSVREITDDPRSGKRDRELTSITQEEPDPALFQPPADYKVVTKDPSGNCSTEPEQNGNEDNNKEESDKE